MASIALLGPYRSRGRYGIMFQSALSRLGFASILRPSLVNDEFSAELGRFRRLTESANARHSTGVQVKVPIPDSFEYRIRMFPATVATSTQAPLPTLRCALRQARRRSIEPEAGIFPPDRM